MRLAATILAIAIAALPCAAQDREEDEALRGLDNVALLLETIRDNYMSKVDTGLLIENGIRGMLGQLDPHSNYFTPEQMRQLMLEQEGEYFGVGMTVGIRNGELTVITPQEGGPAARQGIRTGDLIRAVDGEPTSGQDVETCASKLRGPEGTEVTITIEREGLPEPFDVVIKREMISLKTVPYAMPIANGVGYVRLTRFSRTSGREVSEAIAALKAEGITGLILDLRSNPGGDLDQAVEVTDCFLEEGLIVFTQGSTEASRVDYEASGTRTCWRGPLVVLLNRGSASASEVVAGALQDHDRALLAGENSWGKGLVQSVMPLSHGAALALTTARYFTPSGRLIQRPYAPGSFDDYYDPENHEGEGEMQPARTDLGRIVYGGSGLQPDVVIEESELTALTQQILLRGIIFDFVTHHIAARPDTGADFRADEEVIESFRAFLDESDVEVDEAQWLQDREFIGVRITLETVTRVAGAEAGFRAVLPLDRQVQRAIELMDQAAELLQRRMDAEG